MSMIRQQLVYAKMYNKLVHAIDANSDEQVAVASVNVLGATGDWLGSLTNQELAELLSQVSAELLSRTKEDS